MTMHFRDAQSALGFLTSALLRNHAALEGERFPAFDYMGLVPVVEDGDMWDVGTVVTSASGPIGRAEYISAKGFDIPNVSSGLSQGVSNFYLAACGYEVTLQEVNRAAKLGIDLSSRSERDARIVADKFIYDRFTFGSVEKGFKGLFNDPRVPTANAGFQFATANPDQLSAGINGALTAVYTGTNETSLANTLALPTSAFLAATQTRMTDTGSTVMEYLRQNNSYTALTGKPLKIIASMGLETAGAGGTRRMVAYERDPSTVEAFLPGSQEFMAPHALSSLSWRVDGIFNVGQTEIYRPLAVTYRDGF